MRIKSMATSGGNFGPVNRGGTSGYEDIYSSLRTLCVERNRKRNWSVENRGDVKSSEGS